MGAKGKTRELIVRLLLQKLFNAQPLNGIAILFSTRERPVLKVLLYDSTFGGNSTDCRLDIRSMQAYKYSTKRIRPRLRQKLSLGI